MSKLYAAALILGAFAGTAFLTSVGCSTSSNEEETGTALGAAGEADSGDGGIAKGTLVISAVYPFGGRTGAPLKSDYVEILNKSAKEVTLDGVSLQLSTTSTTAFSIAVPLKGKVGAGKYFLVELGSGGGAGDALTDPDQAAGTDPPQIGESTTGNVRNAGKVALALGATPINCGQNGSACPAAKLLDLVGWGTASAWEGSNSAPAFTDDASAADKKALARPGTSCADTDNNAKDFAAAVPAPRNAATDAVNCNPPKPEAGVDANSIPNPIKENPLGEEPYFDGGYRPEAGPKSAAPGADDGGCSIGAVGMADFSVLSPLGALALGAMFVVRRRKSSQK